MATSEIFFYLIYSYMASITEAVYMDLVPAMSTLTLTHMTHTHMNPTRHISWSCYVEDHVSYTEGIILVTLRYQSASCYSGN